MNDSNEKPNQEIIADFGDVFGSLCKQDIGQAFVDIHASLNSYDLLMKLDADAGIEQAQQ